jgi:hypothetical protein
MLPWLLPKINHFCAGTDSQASAAASGTIHPMPADLRLNSGETFAKISYGFGRPGQKSSTFVSVSFLKIST